MGHGQKQREWRWGLREWHLPLMHMCRDLGGKGTEKYQFPLCPGRGRLLARLVAFVLGPMGEFPEVTPLLTTPASLY